MKNTNVIVFPGGAYGTYLHWAIDTLTSNKPVDDPGSDNGSSHNFKKGRHLGNINGWKAYLSNQAEVSLARLHPKTLANESLVKNLGQISLDAKKIIHLYPDKNSCLLVIHNYLFKTRRNLWNGPLGYIDKSDIYKNWPAETNAPLDQLPPWILREYFSFNLFSAWEDQVEWYLPDHYPETPTYRYLFVSDLLLDFAGTLGWLEEYLEIKYLRPISDILPHHEINLSRQTYFTQQSKAQNILDAIDNSGPPVSWAAGELTIFTEAWIQNQLRSRGIGIKCHGLDLFPNNSIQLQGLLYNI